jgi:fucose permease
MGLAGIPPRTGILVGIAALCFPFVYSMSLRNYRILQPRLDQRAAGALRQKSTIIMLAALSALAMLLEGAIENWVVLFETQRGVNPAVAGGVLAIYAAGSAIARLTGDRLVRAVGSRALFAASGLTAAAGLFFGVNSRGLLTLYTSFAIAGLGTGNLVPLIFSQAGRSSGASSTGITTVSIAGYVSLLAGPPLVGAAARWIGLQNVLEGLATVGLLCVLASATRVVKSTPD